MMIQNTHPHRNSLILSVTQLLISTSEQLLLTNVTLIEKVPIEGTKQSHDAKSNEGRPSDPVIERSECDADAKWKAPKGVEMPTQLSNRPRIHLD